MSYTSNLINDLEYNSERFPTVILNDGTAETLAQAKQWVSENLASLKKELNCTGAILFRGFPVTNAHDYDAFFSAFEYANFTYKESLSNAVRVNHTEHVFTANEAPKDVVIYLHNEMAQTPIYPSIISLFCEAAADHGGATPLCRTDAIYNQLFAAEPKLTAKLERLGIKYTTLMPAEDSLETGQGRSWRGTLNAETVEAAEEKLHHLGYSWSWNKDNSLTAQTSPLPAIRTLEDGRKIFFNQIIAAYMGWKGAKENPATALCFGNDTAISKDFLDTIAAIANTLTYDVAWQDGDVVVVNNDLAMHGRRPYSGDRKRKVLVVLGR